MGINANALRLDGRSLSSSGPLIISLGKGGTWYLISKNIFHHMFLRVPANYCSP